MSADTPALCCAQPAQKNGADDEARTRYLDLGKVALYQMSYIRTVKVLYHGEMPSVNERALLFRKTCRQTYFAQKGAD